MKITLTIPTRCSNQYFSMKKDGKMLLLSQSSPTSQKMDGLNDISDKYRQMTNQNMENDFSVNVSI